MSAPSVESDRVAAERAAAERLTLIRGVLIAFGLLLLLIGGIVFLLDVKPETYLGVAVWLAGAIILHDGVAALAVFGATVLVRRAGGIPFAVRAIIQGALAIAVLVTVLVTPEIIKQAIGSANPSILPLDYVGNLLLFNAGIVVATVVAIIVTLVLRRTRRTAAQKR